MTENNAAQPGENLLDYAMAIAHERELDVTGHKHDSDGAVLRFKAAVDRALPSKLRAPVADERQPDGKRPDLDWIEGVRVTDTVGRGWCVRIDGTDIFEDVNRYGCKGRKSFQIASDLPSKQEAQRVAVEWLDRQRAALASAPVADERAAFEAWNVKTNQGYDLTPMNSGKLATYESDLTEHAWRGYCHAALASSHVAGKATYYAVMHGQRLFGIFETETAAGDCIAKSLYPKVMSIRPLYAAPQATRNIGRLLDAAHTAVEILDNLSDHADAQLASVELSNAAAALASDSGHKAAAVDTSCGHSAAPQASEAVLVYNGALTAAAKVCADIARQYDPQNNQENALASELYSAAAAILKLAKEDSAALSAQPGAQKETSDV